LSLSSRIQKEALALEANLIKQHQPYFNVLLKDDKKYPRVCHLVRGVSRIHHRNRRLGKEKDKYYGPTDSRLLDIGVIQADLRTAATASTLFKDRACLNYDLGRCPVFVSS